MKKRNQSCLNWQLNALIWTHRFGWKCWNIHPLWIRCRLHLILIYFRLHLNCHALSIQTKLTKHRRTHPNSEKSISIVSQRHKMKNIFQKHRESWVNLNEFNTQNNSLFLCFHRAMQDELVLIVHILLGQFSHCVWPYYISNYLIKESAFRWSLSEKFKAMIFINLKECFFFCSLCCCGCYCCCCCRCCC